MNMDQSTVFLGASILTVLGFIVIAIGIVVINNIIAKFWKPVRIFTADSWAAMNTTFVNQEELTKKETK